MKLLPVRQKGVVVAHAMVDDDDYDALSRYRWRLNRDGYVVRSFGHRGFAQIHREILGLVPGDGLQADHKSRNRLDNQRSNLRVLTHAQNGQNRPGHNYSSSSYRGVSRCQDKGKRPWRARVRVAGRLIHIGYFDDELKAARAASAYRSEHLSYSIEPVL